ncbi:MAG: purine-nucleoside phosphorylase [Oscillospiraceae bacterium]|nr:purine-nucleoside phosphorylase [Oscillospiraceae bacterium]
MNSTYAKLLSCRDQIRAKTDFVPQIAITLGSGLGAFAEMIEPEAVVDYRDIEGFPVSTAPSHAGRFVFGRLDGIPVVVMQGRVHYYEGYSPSDVVLPARVCGLLGAKALVLTNAAGGVNPEFSAGDLMLITDHLMPLFPNPLIGENIDELGVRFPDMSEVYDRELRDALRAEAQKLDIPLREGVYIQFTGPSYETPAEVRMAGLLGADAVGMSTACEAVAARHMGLRVAGISCISNKAAGLSAVPLTQEEVEQTAAIAAPRFRSLLWNGVKAISKLM